LKFKYKLSLIFLLIPLFFGCSENPNQIGLDAIPDYDKLNLKSWNTNENPIEMESATLQDSISTSYSSIILLGQTNNVKSTLLLKFLISLPDSIKNALSADSLIIRKAYLKASIVYKQGNGPNLNFTVNNILQSWTSTTFTKDSLELLTTDPTNLYQSQVITDSTFQFDFNVAPVYDWFKSYIDPDTYSNYGLLLNPTNSDLILGFPALSASLSAAQFHLYTIVEKPGEFIDTLSFYTSIDLHLVDRAYPTDTESRITLQAGTGVRGKLKFDLTTFPKNSIINKAIVRIFYEKTEADFGSNPSDSIIVYMLNSNSDFNVRTDVGKWLLTADSLKYSGTITEFVQHWIDYPDSNNGMQLRLLDEYDATSEVKLYPANYVDPTKRPYLEIIYTRL